MEFKIIMDIDKIKVYSPYNPEFVRRIKHMKGKWRDGCWEVRADLIEEVRALMVEIYGRDDRPTKMVNIKVCLLYTSHLTHYPLMRQKVMLCMVHLQRYSPLL